MEYEPGEVIIYACVATKDNILADYAEVSIPKLDSVLHEITKKVGDQPTSVIRQDNLIIHVHSHIQETSQLITIAVTGTNFPTDRCFDFLEDVSSSFAKMYERGQYEHCLERAFNPTFSVLVKQKMKHANDNNTITVTVLDNPQGEIITRTNDDISMLIDNDTRLDELHDQAKMLLQTTIDKENDSKLLRQRTFLTTSKMFFLLFILIIVVTFLIIWGACGITFEKCRN
ncbi:vesicle-associated membrane protein, putative [Entamoeba invadens IP1]|uniref:Vesicle-associated membrane protein, putative n=1 Tax=Entamoeba invadens IP1 TaxID=370355 RepID=A0A0A1TWN1_ENTIV|nr:vesicle-associated membrane protein, putative [Entamoeba invadens IP1]ELP85576.1 vesicle-associated membrane protein, putative [Entamoeba invadens IP1]|eukprot:XP_004184922.1 vesicle-associated membrane protein, putative [Entamoeba invadens IP1]